jgi:hypothetical protein
MTMDANLTQVIEFVAASPGMHAFGVGDDLAELSTAPCGKLPSKSSVATSRERA